MLRRACALAGSPGPTCITVLLGTVIFSAKGRMGIRNKSGVVWSTLFFTRHDYFYRLKALIKCLCNLFP